MPPNRKGNFDVVDGLATLTVDDLRPDVAKFAPLTSQPIAAPAPTEKSTVHGEVIVQASHVHDQTHPAQSYWDWQSNDTNTHDVTSQKTVDKQAMIQRILEEERVRQLLTVDRVQANLSKEDADATQEPVRNARGKDDGYWDEVAPETVAKEVAPSVKTISANHATDATHPLSSYWNWTTVISKTEEQKEIIRKILVEEKARLLVSASTTQDRLTASVVDKDNIHTTDNLKPENDSYWNWEDGSKDNENDRSSAASYWAWPTLTAAEEKEQLIQRIMEEEKIRKQLSASTVQEQMITSCRSMAPSSTPSSSACFGDASHFVGEQSYWDW